MEGGSEPERVLRSSKTILKNARRRKWTKIRSLDGAYKNYTAAVLTSMSLGITILFFERGFFQGRGGKHFLIGDIRETSIAGKRIISSLLLLLAAGVIGAVSHLLLVPNLKTMKHQLEGAARRWIFYSMLAMLMVNCLSVALAVEAESAFQVDQDESIFVSTPAHYILLVGFLISVLVLDFLYLRVILLPFVEVDNSNISRAMRNWQRVRSIVFYHSETLQRLGKDKKKGLCQYCAQKYNSGIDILALWAINGTRQAADAFQYMLSCGSRTRNGEVAQRTSSQNEQSKVGELCWRLRLWLTTSSLGRFFGAICGSLTNVINQISRPIKTYYKKLEDWGKTYDPSTKHPWYQQITYRMLISWEGMINGINSLRANTNKFFNRLWDSVKEDEDFQHSSWVNAAVITSILLLVYFGLTLVQGFHGFYKDLYLPHRNCAKENEQVTDFFLRTIGFSDTQNGEMQVTGPVPQTAGFFQEALFDFEEEEREGSIEIPSCARHMVSSTVNGSPNDVPKAIYAALVAYEKDRQDQESRSPVKVFQRSSIGSILYVLDVLMSNMDWAVWVGLCAGIAVGIFSLLGVFAQYKRVSFAIRSGDFEKLPADIKQMIEGLDDASLLQQHQKWDRLFSAYPMSLSVFFFGMLVSTAVVQLAVFGLLVSLIFAGSVSLLDSEVYRILKPFMAFLIAFLLTWFLHGFLATRFVGDAWLLDGDSVVHEMGFLLFLLVYTALHLVLGIFLAIVRLLILMLMAFSRINRLDTNLYITWKHLDRGHKSFIAMVLLQFAFQTARTDDGGRNDLWRSVLGQLRIQVPERGTNLEQEVDISSRMKSNPSTAKYLNGDTSTAYPPICIEVSSEDDTRSR